MPLYFFWGEEDFLIEKEINAVKKKFLGGEINGLNYKCADNPDFSTLVYMLRSQPMMFGDTVYNIKVNRYFLEGGKKISLDDNQTAEIIDAMELISDKNHVIFNCPCPRGEGKKPDSRKKMFKAIQNFGTIKECPAFKAYEEYKILPVLKEMLKEYNLKGGNDVLTEIIRRSGPYFRDLSSALDKISLFVYPNNIITKEAVDNLYPLSYNIFALSDLILQKKYDDAMAQISSMTQNSHPLEILAFLQPTFSKILATKIYSKTMSGFEIAKKTGQNEYAVKKTLEKIRNVDLSRIIKLKENLVQAEFEIKTGTKEPMTAILEGFVK